MSEGETLRPYVADLVIDWLRETPDATYREVEGTLAFVDISGFTALTERLARAGAVGAEEMSDILSAVFTDLLAVAFSYGAWLVKWGGDAVLLLFEGEEHPAMACRAAVEMRRALRGAGHLAGCLPGPIADYVLGGAGDGEHRRVAVAFVEFSGTGKLLADGGPKAVATALQELVGLAEEACHRCDVTFLETDISPDGGKIMLVAGAPRSEGHHEQRLLRAARAIIEYGGPLSVRAGANSGRVFAGDFGPPYRRTYSVKGDAVNLAARVMSRAEPGQLLATTALLDGPASGFRYTPLPPFRVKGKSKPVNAVEVGAAQQPPRRGGADVPPLVGRNAEISRLRAALATARAGHGQVAEIAGPPGIGKSRLADELLATTDGLTLLVTCDRYAAGRPTR
ncbi:MAG: adenylate/guanylate cyclase domain-containing protein [Streptosporangiaceae bacterium]